MLTISAIVPIHSRLEYLYEAVQSLLAQTHPIDQIFLISDRPDAYEVVSPLLSDKVSYVQVPDAFGQSDSMNHGISLAETDVVFTLDDDDLLCPNYIKSALEVMDWFNVDIVYPDMEIFGIESGIVRALDWNKENFYKTTVPFGVSIMKRNVWDVIRYKANLQYLDWDFWWTAFEIGFTAYHLEEVGFKYRTHLGQRSRNCDVDEEIRKVRALHEP